MAQRTVLRFPGARAGAPAGSGRATGAGAGDSAGGIPRVGAIEAAGALVVNDLLQDRPVAAPAAPPRDEQVPLESQTLALMRAFWTGREPPDPAVSRAAGAVLPEPATAPHGDAADGPAPGAGARPSRRRWAALAALVVAAAGSVIAIRELPEGRVPVAAGPEPGPAAAPASPPGSDSPPAEPIPSAAVPESDRAAMAIDAPATAPVPLVPPQAPPLADPEAVIAPAPPERAVEAKTPSEARPPAGPAEARSEAIVMAPSPFADDDPDRAAVIHRLPPPAATVPAETLAAPRPALDAGQVSAMTRRAEALVSIGDLSGARLFYERLALAGHKPAALMLARSYDAAWLRRQGVVGVPADAERAAYWYERAARLPD
jgi:hypothetical protein